MIEIQNISEFKQPFSEQNIDTIIDLILQEETKKQKGAICIVFCNDKQLLKINQEYLQHDFFTDIITFDYSEENTISGDLTISLERVKENAIRFKTTYFVELLRVIIHGVLHLCGYKDKRSLEKILMRFKENLYLNNFVSRETLRSVR
jgi:probable rRNA maturation factor